MSVCPTSLPCWKLGLLILTISHYPAAVSGCDPIREGWRLLELEGGYGRAWLEERHLWPDRRQGKGGLVPMEELPPAGGWGICQGFCGSDMGARGVSTSPRPSEVGSSVWRGQRRNKAIGGAEPLGATNVPKAPMEKKVQSQLKSTLGHCIH